ncbi:hypothetical protein R3X25_05320 [Lutibacter sp. TH_r2]|uniref:hypothetical protein n=1 Tax=Lutibacter sp. TH_r2 TaxID=3082083 RepID=UPI0029550291|nr:hypothetical protein [Lutibacter sp. TH_r2]MDV7186694.1 hypothetical protein [Lutibacter sp. TH_r2]
MKTLKLLFATLILGALVSSCSVSVHNIEDEYYASLEDVVTAYDLWYVDYHKTSGNSQLEFMNIAFTLSFQNGRVYANNNIVGIGSTGNGYGIQVGYYDTYKGFLEIDHQIDGYVDFDVIQISSDRIKLIDNYNNVTYYLEGYYKNNFDFDQVFYDNIEYFLQEYEAWGKTYTSDEGDLNEFDNENYLAFTPENNTTFYSSQDQVGTNIDNLLWDYEGEYIVYDVNGYDNLKILTLNYDSYGTEEFELSVINDGRIKLYHNASGTTYKFDGLGYIQLMKTSANKSEKSVSNQYRKRTKIIRETKDRQKH